MDGVNAVLVLLIGLLGTLEGQKTLAALKASPTNVPRRVPIPLASTSRESGTLLGSAIWMLIGA